MRFPNRSIEDADEDRRWKMRRKNASSRALRTADLGADERRFEMTRGAGAQGTDLSQRRGRGVPGRFCGLR